MSIYEASLRKSPNPPLSPSLLIAYFPEKNGKMGTQFPISSFLNCWARNGHTQKENTRDYNAFRTVSFLFIFAA